MFEHTPMQETVALWLAAGQDGQCVYWLKRTGSELQAKQDDDLQDTIPPAFSPSGRELLVVEGLGTLQKFAFPDVRLLGQCDSPFGEDDVFATSVSYLDATHAITGSHNGRIALVDTAAMKVLGEVIVEDHEPRTMREYFPRLAYPDPGLCTDLSHFVPAAGCIAFAYAAQENTGRAAQLLCYPASTPRATC